MSEIIEFCFRPQCDYRAGEPPPTWFLDPFQEDELWPRLYCPACGKPRWLAMDADEFKDHFALDIEPRGIWFEFASMVFRDGLQSRVSDVHIAVLGQGSRDPVAILWDIRVRNEYSVRQTYDLGLPDACRFGPLTSCECMVCAVCGNQNWATADLTPVMTRPGDMVWICRHGHFHGENINAITGMVQHLTGPRMLEVLVWTPELVVPDLRWRWFGGPLCVNPCQV